MAKYSATEHHENRLLAALEPEDYSFLEPHLEIVSLARGDILFDIGDPVHHAYFPLSAVISLVNVMCDGSTVEVAVFGREGVLGLAGTLVTQEAFGRYIVQLPGRASRLPLNRLIAVGNARPKVQQLLQRHGEALLVQTFQTVSCNAVHSVEARFCRWILSMHDRSDDDTLPLTHEFLAEMLGVGRPSVSIIARTLQTAGLIRQNRGHITVIDRDGLEETACECYGRIRQIYQRLLPGTYPKRAAAQLPASARTRVGGHAASRIWRE